MIKHKGLFRKRLNNNPREKAFADLWEKENDPSTSWKKETGLLQALFITDNVNFNIINSPIRRIFEISQREAVIVATVIQWLGSNVGMDFIKTALEKCGYTILKDIEFKQEYLCVPNQSEFDYYLDSIAKEYHERTEAYDRTVCTGRILRNSIMPRTQEEKKSIEKNALNTLKELVLRAKFEKGIKKIDVQKAISSWRE